MNENVPSDIIAKIQAKYDWMKQRGYYVGDPVEPGIYRTLDGGWQCNYNGPCAIVIRPGETEPHEIHGAIGQRWYREWGAFDISGKRGSLGHPISDEEIYEGDGDPNDRISHFENGDIIWTAKTDETRIVNIKDRARWYKAKHDQLLDLLRRAVEAIDVKRHNEALKAVDAKCKEDQFDVVLLGEFQYGKSTTLDTLCGGREISPQGEGTTPTSAVPVSIQALDQNESNEWGEIRFKSKREIAAEFFDTFAEELSDAESEHPLKAFIISGNGSLRDRFCDGFDPDDPKHLGAVRNSLETAWKRFGESDASKFDFSTKQRQLMEVATLIVRFYGTDEYKAMLGMTKSPVEAVGGFVWFPADWSDGASMGFDYDILFDDVRFAFVDSVVLHIRAPFLEDLGCRVTDCPGLDASAYDKEVTRRALLRADGVLFVHRCSKMVGASTLGTLFEFVQDTGRTSKTVLALNLWGISRDKALLPHDDHRGRKKPPIVGESEGQIRKDGYGTMPVVWCHILLAYLSALGTRRIRADVPFTETERRWLAEKVGKEDEGQTDESLWLAAVEEANSLFKVPELNGLSILDENAVDVVRKASNIDALIAATKETVLRERTESILVDNGSHKALDTLKSHEYELQLIEDEAVRSEQACAEEVEIARQTLKDYNKEADDTINSSHLKIMRIGAIEGLTDTLLRDILSKTYINDVARKIAEMIVQLKKEIPIICFSLGEEIKGRFAKETLQLLIDTYATQSIVTVEKWMKDNLSPMGTFLGYISALNSALHELGNRHFAGKHLFRHVPLPEIRSAIQKESLITGIQNPMRKYLSDIAGILRDGFLGSVIDMIKWLFTFGFFFGASSPDISKIEERVRPKIESLFMDESIRKQLRRGVKPVFETIYDGALASLQKERDSYSRQINKRCDELTESHKQSIDKQKMVAESNRKLREECIAPLRAEIELFEKTVKTALP